MISEPGNEVEISAASYWEIAIKMRLGKYSLPGLYAEFMERQIDVNDFRILHSQQKPAAAVSVMPHHHRDPFDRLIVAQAMVEAIAIVSNDDALDVRDCRLW